IERTVLLLVKAARGEFGGEEPLKSAVDAATRSPELLQIGGIVLAAQAQVQLLQGARIENLEALRRGFSWAQQAHYQRHIQELGYWLWRGGEKNVAGVDPASPRGLQMAGLWREAAKGWRQLGCPLEEAQSLLQGDAGAREQARAIFLRLGAHGWLARGAEVMASGQR
ncbi:MAG TPA: hypothetical protein VEE84_01050, partial [Burkholderiaceae bacterium]|nr:hypothetical protein [Burkholderiaceae bacterium]